jgi:hypothetical protein
MQKGCLGFFSVIKISSDDSTGFEEDFDSWINHRDDEDEVEQVIHSEEIDDEINDDYLLNMSKEDLVHRLHELNEQTLEKEIVKLSPEGFEDLKRMMIEDVIAEIKRREQHELH